MPYLTPSPPTGKDGIVSFWLFFKPGVWSTSDEFKRDVLGYPKSKPEVAKACADHIQNNLTDIFIDYAFFNMPSASASWKKIRSRWWKGAWVRFFPTRFSFDPPSPTRDA